jgi:hypothetical protein
MRKTSGIGPSADIPPALDAALTEPERELLVVLLDPERDASELARRLLDDALSD